MPNFVSETHSINTRFSKYRNYEIINTANLPYANKSFTIHCSKVWNKIPNLLKTQTDLRELTLKEFTKQITEYFSFCTKNCF